MAPPPELSGPGRTPRAPLTTIPDLTDKIIRPDDQYCEAGAFGDVFRCRYKSDNGVMEVAVKAFRFRFTVDEHDRDESKTARMIRRELGIWKRLSHRNVVPFLGVAYRFGRQGSASLVSTWMPHGTLYKFLEAHGDQLAVAHRLHLLSDISRGLHYLHSFPQPIVHGDLSSNNVLLDHNYNACLSDFGCATLVGELPDGFTYLQMSTVRPGTLRWAAPEHFSLNEDEIKYTVEADIYSFGNMALLVLSGKLPWSEVRSDAAVMLHLSQGHKPGRPLERPIDNRHWALIERCWALTSNRPSAEHVVSSLQQFLGACLPAPSLRDLLDVPTPPSSVPAVCGDGDLDRVNLKEASHGLSRSCTPIGTHASAVLPTSEDIMGPSDPSTHSPEHISLASPDLQKGVDNELGALPRPPPSKFIRGEFLGRGTYGTVYLALDTSTGKMIAVKQVEKDEKDDWRLDFVNELKMEREILSKLNHPHIIAYLGFEETPTVLSVLLEYVPGGSIASCLREHGTFDGEVVKSFTAQVFDGLAYLHANRIIHRNIEPNSILVELSGICKISGLGNAKRPHDHASRIPMRGITLWTAPEMTRSRGESYGPKVDVWSAGCVLFKMWTGSRQKSDDEGAFVSMLKAMHRGTLPPLPVNVATPHLAADLRNRCLASDPGARSSAADLVQHPYLKLAPDWVFSGFR